MAGTRLVKFFRLFSTHSHTDTDTHTYTEHTSHNTRMHLIPVWQSRVCVCVRVSATPSKQVCKSRARLRIRSHTRARAQGHRIPDFWRQNKRATTPHNIEKRTRCSDHRTGLPCSPCSESQRERAPFFLFFQLRIHILAHARVRKSGVIWDCAICNFALKEMRINAIAKNCRNSALGRPTMIMVRHLNLHSIRFS